MTTQPITHNGQPVSLAHLAPFTFLCACKALGRDLVIRASFSNHCYTEAFDPALHTTAQIIIWEGGKHKPRARVFCPVRHGLSTGLPAIVQGFPTNRVHQTHQQRNYVYVAALPVGGQTYDVFFMLQRSGGGSDDLRLTVESAYPQTAPLVLPKRPNDIRFAVLAYKVFANQRVQFAPR